MGRGEEWLADYTRRIGEIQRRAEEAQEQIRTLRARATSPDGSVSVMLAPGGRLEKLDLTQRALDLGPGRLAALITQTVQAAHADAAEQTQSAIMPLVGESDAMEFLREQIGTALPEEPEQEQDSSGGQAPSAASQPPQPRRPRPDNDDDEPFGGPILR